MLRAEERDADASRAHRASIRRRRRRRRRRRPRCACARNRSRRSADAVVGPARARAAAAPQPTSTHSKARDRHRRASFLRPPPTRSLSTPNVASCGHLGRHRCRQARADRRDPRDGHPPYLHHHASSRRTISQRALAIPYEPTWALASPDQEKALQEALAERASQLQVLRLPEKRALMGEQALVFLLPSLLSPRANEDFRV